jgi:hypothetical protein
VRYGRLDIALEQLHEGDVSLILALKERSLACSDVERARLLEVHPGGIEIAAL